MGAKSSKPKYIVQGSNSSSGRGGSRSTFYA